MEQCLYDQAMNCRAIIKYPVGINQQGGSSKWIHETFPEQKLFSWQEGYGAFSIGISNVDETIKYIENQENHHKEIGFQDEYLNFLRKNNVEFDVKYLWGE